MTSAPPWSAVRALFEQALPLTEAGRAALMAAAGRDAPGHGAALAAEVRSLLQHHEAATMGALSSGAARIDIGRPATDQLARPAPAAGGDGTATRIGQPLGAWRITAALGRGGMGEVWLAERADGAFKGEAAIKVLKRGMDSAAVLARFAHEQQALARLSHPHIARLLDAGRTPEGLPYFVMERVVGQPIDQACRGRTLQERLRLFLQLADAVSHAHRHLLVHRDLKPSNVLVRDDGQVTLLDFGIAKALDPLESHDGLTTLAGERPFTPHYASPEQVRGDPVTTATDVYSLAVVLYRMLTGSRPTGRQATTPMQAARCVIDEEPTRPSRLTDSEVSEPQWPALRRQLRGDIDNILLKALEKAPERRFASVDAMAADVRAFLDGRPVSAHGASAGYVLGKFLRRNRWAVFALALGGAGLATGVVATLQQGRVATALGGVGLAAGLVVALFQGRKAELARERAERHVGELRQLARNVVVEYGDAITYVPGGHGHKARMLEATVAHLERLAPAAAGDLGLQAEVGLMHARLAELHSTREYNAAADLSRAELHGQRAAATCAAVEATVTREAAFYRWWARALVACAEAAQELRHDPAAALALLHEADNVLQRGLTLHPGNAQLRRARADGLLQMAEVHFGWNKPNLGQWAEALDLLRRSLPLYEQGLAEAGAAYDLHQYGAALGQMALIHARREQWPQAIGAGREGVIYRQRASDAEPHNQAYRGAVAAECNLVGGLFLNVGDATRALEYTRRAWQLLDQLMRAEPDHTAWTFLRRSLAFNHGRALLGTGATLEAREVLAVSSEWLQHLADAGQASPAQVRRLALTRLAEAEAMPALDADGLQRARDAAALLTELTVRNAEDRQAWLALGQCAVALMDWCAGGDHSAAAHWKRTASAAYACAEQRGALTAVHAEWACRARE